MFLITCVEPEEDEVYYKRIVLRMDFSLVNLNNLSSMPLKSVFALFLSIFIFSCSAPPKKAPKKTDESTKVSAPVIETEKALTADDYLALAQSETPHESIESFTQASQLYLQAADNYKALWLAQQTLSLITALETADQPFVEPQYNLLLINTAALIDLGDYKRAYEQQLKLESLIETHNLTPDYRYYHLSALLYADQGKAVASANANLFAFNAKPQATFNDVELIWLQLSYLATWQVKQLSDLSPPAIDGWAELLSIANQYGGDKTSFELKLVSWQSNYPTHPAQAVVNSLLNPAPIEISEQTETASEPINDNELATEISQEKVTSPTTTQPVPLNAPVGFERFDTTQKTYPHLPDEPSQKVAVILPLSGKQSIAGITLQQGILASYKNDRTKMLVFIDSAQLDMTTLPETLAEQDIEFIIGPLLKANVETFAQLQIDIPTLLLNHDDNHQLTDNQFVFSMMPEDEAKQAASILSQQRFTHPVVLSHQDNVSKRISEAFIKQWEKLSGDSPKVIYFNSGGGMQDDIKNSLDVDQSAIRIKRLKSRLDQQILDKTRSRRDIDMIYLIASPQTSQLVKPYIDVNTSAFADIIPVFASSKSHRGHSDASDGRDLDKLTFTDIPWLLPVEQKDTELALQAKALWPRRHVNLERLYAMGIDSYNLIDHALAMKAAPYIRHYGQTGILRINKQNMIIRSLFWGTYHNEKVKKIVME